MANIDISIGAVGAAIVAGIVSLFGLIIGKEQKTSEFRQKWIDDLRGCFISYIVNINSISDCVRLIKSGNDEAKNTLAEKYKSINEASHGIMLRINSKEKAAKNLINIMRDFENLAKKIATLPQKKFPFLK